MCACGRRHHVCFHGKSSDSNYDALFGSVSDPGASPVAIVPYYLYTTVQICSVPVMQETSQSAPAPMGAGLAQGGIITMKRGFLQSRNEWKVSQGKKLPHKRALPNLLHSGFSFP